MEIVIKAITPNTAHVFTDFFESVAFDHAPDWATCYCQYYHHKCDESTWVSRTGDDNKFDAQKDIQNNHMKGFMAYDGDRCIGWLNTNDLKAYKRLEDVYETYGQGQRVAVTICFIIDPAYRGKSIARQLLSHAISYYKNEGYDAMIGLPFEAKGQNQKRYRGTHNMYLENAYQLIDQLDNVAVFKLDLKAL